MKIRIAIVDDELTSRNLIKRMLEDNDTYEVTAEFSDPKAALEWLRKNEIDILLCDIQMPEMNGIELMRMVHIIWAYLPVVAISGYADFDYVRGCMANGASDYLLKHELSKEKIIEVLDNVRQKYRIEPKETVGYRKIGWCCYDENQFGAENIRDMIERGEIDFCCRNTFTIGIAPDFQVPLHVNTAEYKKDINRALIDIIKQSLGQEYKYMVYCNKKDYLLLILSFVNTVSTFYTLNVVDNLINRVRRQSIRMLDTTLSVITGELHNELKTSVEEAYII